MYMSKFFKTLDEAEEFRKKNGGALYKLKARVKKGQGPNSYTIEAMMRGMTEEEMQALPYCIAWNQK
jgi:hypothetical protein